MGSCGGHLLHMAPKQIFVAVVALLCCSVAPTDAKTLAQLQAQIAALQAQVAAAQTRMASVQANLRTTIAAADSDAVAVADAYLASGTKCGPTQVTGFSEHVDVYYKKNEKTVNAITTFTSDRFTAPVTGWYMVCAFFRFRNTGNSNDVTIRKNGAIVAAFGNAIQYDWRSTGTCTIQKMTANEYIDLYHWSGDSNDCIEETGWRYGRFNAHLIGCSAADCS